MSFLNSSFIDSDNELSKFAQALALPARIAIVRFIAENDNSITPQELCLIPFNQRIVIQHVLELKNLGILNVKQSGDNIAYCINQNLFDKMASNFSTLTDNINSFRSPAK